jgi:hypothetical protein
MYEGLSGPELVKAYNKMAQVLGEKLIARFSSAEVGRRRCAEIAEKLASAGKTVVDEASKAIFGARPSSKRGKLFSFLLKRVNKSLPVGDIAEGVGQARGTVMSGLRMLKARLSKERSAEYELVKDGADYGLYTKTSSH